MGDSEVLGFPKLGHRGYCNFCRDFVNYFLNTGAGELWCNSPATLKPPFLRISKADCLSNNMSGLVSIVLIKHRLYQFWKEFIWLQI